MARIYGEQDVNSQVLKDRRVVVLGYGNQGRAHALNLRDSGVQVRVGLPLDREGARRAAAEGLEVMAPAEAVRWADVVMMLLPDEVQPGFWKEHLEGAWRQGQMLLFAHGFAVHFGAIACPEGVDVALVAPKSPGALVRSEYQEGRGVPGLVAVAQDASGQALDLALGYASALGLTRAGVFQTTFQEETETDLFGEQAVLCGGLAALMRNGFEVLVEAGYQPEMAWFECVNEMKLIVDLVAEQGLDGMHRAISNTAEYGDYLAQERYGAAGVKGLMQGMLAEIRSGAFARSWLETCAQGGERLHRERRAMEAHPMEVVGRRLRGMMAWRQAGRGSTDAQ